MSFLSVLASVLGIAMGIANVPQAVKIFRRRSAKDISIITFAILFAGSVAWILYGVEIADFPILISYSVGLLPICAVIVGWFLYGR